MFLNETHVRRITKQFMPRVKSNSINAMVDVASHGLSILASAQKHGVTHQSLSKNLINFQKLQAKINAAKTTSTFTNSYLLEAYIHALIMDEVAYSKAIKYLDTMCKSLGGNMRVIDDNQEIILCLDNTLTSVFRNPVSFEREWSFNLTTTD